MANLTALRLAVSRKFSLDQTASGEEETAVTGWLNEGVVEVLLETHCTVSRGTTTLTANTADYTLDTDILAIHKIIDSNNVPLDQVTESEIEELRRASATASASVQRYAVAGSMLMIWPTPSAASTLTVYFVPRPTPMSAGTHDPSDATYGGIPTEYHKGIELYATWQAADYDDDISSAQGDRYFGQYSAWVNKIRKNNKLRGGAKMPKANRGLRNLRSNDPSRT